METTSRSGLKYEFFMTLFYLVKMNRLNVRVESGVSEDGDVE